MTCEDLVRLWKLIPLREQRAALLIGFEGGSALLGHNTSEQMFTEILAEQSIPYRQAFGPSNQLIRSKWRGLPPVQQEKILKEHTKSITPDPETVAFIATLLQQHVIHSIVITDPNCDLFYMLRERDVSNLQRLDCAEIRPAVLERHARHFQHAISRPLFIDGADILLDHLEPSYTGLEGPYLAEMHAALRHFLDMFDYVFCWGWCYYNLTITKIWTPRPQNFYVLGEYSDGARVSHSDITAVVEDPVDPSSVTTALLNKTATTFSPHRAAASTRLETSSRQGSAQKTPFLILPEDSLQRIFDTMQLNSIIVLSAEGPRVRSRILSYISRKFQEKYPERPYQLLSQTSPPLLRRTIQGISGISTPFYVFAEARESPQPSDGWQQPFISYAMNWSKNLEPSHSKLILLLPAAWAESIRPEVERIQSAVFFDPFFSEIYMNTEYIERWLKDANDLRDWAIIQQGQNNAVHALSSYLLSETSTKVSHLLDGSAFDCFHDLLDLWYTEVCLKWYESQRSNRPFLIQECKEIWDKILNAYTLEEQILDIDVRKRSSKDTNDFDLGLIYGRGSSGNNDNNNDDIDLEIHQRNIP